METVDVLKQIGFFKGLQEPSLQAVADLCVSKTCRRHEALFSEGAIGHSLYICVHGQIQLAKSTADGKEIVIKIIGSGEMFGEVVLFEQNRYPVNAMALTRSLLFQLPKEKFCRLLAQTDFRNDFIRMLMAKQRYLAEQIKFLSTFDVEERLRRFLLDQFGKRSRIVLSVSKKEVANAIITTPETLSRVLLRLKKEKLVTWQARTVMIADEFWQ
jgi:CRP/FNR family transcriptional regulator, dissimilatory nitrate respiration regulator